MCGGFCVLSVPVVNEAEMEDSIRSATLLLGGRHSGDSAGAESWSGIAAGCDGRGDELVMRGGAERVRGDGQSLTGGMSG